MVPEIAPPGGLLCEILAFFAALLLIIVPRIVCSKMQTRLNGITETNNLTFLACRWLNAAHGCRLERRSEQPRDAQTFHAESTCQLEFTAEI
jgi:hypothetical protein